MWKEKLKESDNNIEIQHERVDNNSKNRNESKMHEVNNTPMNKLDETIKCYKDNKKLSSISSIKKSSKHALDDTSKFMIEGKDSNNSAENNISNIEVDNKDTGIDNLAY